MHEPFTCQKQRKNVRQSRKKPSVKAEVHGGVKNENQPFTSHVSKLTCHQNTLLMHGKCYFWNWQLTVSAPLNCGAADLDQAKNSKFYQVSKLKFCHLGFVHFHPKAMFGCFPLNFSIISVILVAYGRSKASYLSLTFYLQFSTSI